MIADKPQQRTSEHTNARTHTRTPTPPPTHTYTFTHTCSEQRKEASKESDEEADEVWRWGVLRVVYLKHGLVRRVQGDSVHARGEVAVLEVVLLVRDRQRAIALVVGGVFFSRVGREARSEANKCDYGQQLCDEHAFNCEEGKHMIS